MPSYGELATESWYLDEYEPPNFAAFLARLRAHYGHTRAQTGAKGDNRHLRGRHRSMAWCRNSIYCTDRSYATRDPRDTAGDPNALRGFDLGVTGLELRAVSTRVDAAVRAGALPQMAEWFGTTDGTTVVGWFEGHSSTSDTSHLGHFHGGIWTKHVNDREFLDRLFATITGEDMPTVAEFWGAKWKDYVPAPDGTRPLQTAIDALFCARADAHYARAEVTALRTALEGMAKGDPDVAAILAGMDERLAALRGDLRAVIDEELDEQSRAGADADN